MSRDKSEIVVICEGGADENFIRTFLKKKGYDKRAVRVCDYPHGKGAGEQFVRNRFPKELKEIRRRQGKFLVVMIDGDGFTVAERRAQIAAACRTHEVPPPTEKDPVFIGVPMRNIETWFCYLSGLAWSEETDCKSHRTDDLAAPAAGQLFYYCYKEQRLPQPAPQSLVQACADFNSTWAV